MSRSTPSWDAVWSDGSGLHIRVARHHVKYALFVHDERSPLANGVPLATFYTERGALKFVNTLDKLTKYRRIGSV